MASRRKLEEEIARTKDPELRKQLEILLLKREMRWEDTKEKIKDFLNLSWLN